MNENITSKAKKTSLADIKDTILRQKYLLLMIWPALIWMVIFNYIPIGGVIIAFKDYRIIHSFLEAPWAANFGFAHFIEFFSEGLEGDLWLVMKNTLGISFFKLLIGFPLPIIFALFLNELRSIKFKGFVQTISYLPHFLSWVILGGILITWLSTGGLFNSILKNTGLLKEPISFMAEPEYFWGIAVISDIWKELGWGSIIYLAAIAGVDQEMYEAATIDGAGRFSKMWHITIPSISGAISIMLILAISGILNTNFDQMLVLSNPANFESSSVIDIFVYQMGIRQGRFSYATAVGLFKAVIALILLLGANSTMKKLTGKTLF